MNSDQDDFQDDSGMEPIVVVAIVAAVLLLVVIIVLIMCWKLRSNKHNHDTENNNVVYLNPVTDEPDSLKQVKVALIEDPFQLKQGTPLSGDDKDKFDLCAKEMRPERIKFLIILNSLRRDAKHYTPDSDAFYTFRESIHELSRLLHCYNESPEGVVPEDGLELHNWAQQILYIYNTENRIVPQLYNNLSMTDSLDGVHVHKLRGSMRRRADSDTDEDSDVSDQQIRVDIDEEHTVDDSEEEEEESGDEIIAAPPQFTQQQQYNQHYSTGQQQYSPRAEQYQQDAQPGDEEYY